ncbi:diguanylate cyclase domain-containing protein [Propionivibrio dicarboxylicus]|uniref:PAS domain S-box-containing protein/diguanylate cyclase (GGDEF) domain-containing protein n=1 Tax=Propionivibrio dicarboxylicus TaxID=83767 RepID=A0A1G8EVL0_9RHOO|nr:diguanylate cyclase [Propionivibrio dicarboxylicus]SDH73956.1 PAS domain S-box-containing protein/diguanylate cyclase (GGDEF) domain-containing protein [Propionivibrio dicarboxylicus]
MNYWHSLAGRLFRLVFGGYLVLAIVVTAVQLILEYATIRQQIHEDLDSLGQSFNGGVANAMWELDVPLMKTMAHGIAQSSIVTGVKIASAEGEILATEGDIPSTNENLALGFLAPFQFNATPLKRKTPTGLRKLGELTIYADRSVALNRVKYSFFVILINSLIKTTGLWLIFYLVINKGLSRPLAKLTEVVTQFELIAGAKETISIDYPYQDELGRLMASMRTMQERLRRAHEALEHSNRNLEKTVAERTQHLSEAYEFNEKILLSSPVAMGVYRSDGQCVMANQAYAELVGGTLDALLAHNFNDHLAWKDSGLFDACREALAQRVPQRIVIDLLTSFDKMVSLDCQLLPTVIGGNAHLLIQFFDLTERKRLEEELRHFAFHDPLTLLPNRRLLVEKIQHALRSGKRRASHVALLFIDLNRFKELNDTHGHESGDRLLVEVAKRLTNAVRDADTVARLGGDEFIVLLEDLGPDHELAYHYAGSVLQKIRQTFDAEIRLGRGVFHRCSASIGIQIARGDETDAETLIRQADAMMYEEKKRRRSAD